MHVNLSLDAINRVGEIVMRNPLEIMEEKRKIVEIPCYWLRYICSAVRFYIQDTAMKIIQHSLFETVSLLVILANCVILSMDDPTSDAQEDWQVQADIVFQVLYSIEIGIKVLGLGFVFNQGAYLRDPWNVLDFVIVIFGYFSYLQISGGIDLKALRTFRVLRPLRTISSVEGLKLLISTLIGSLPLLMDTIVILMFFFMIFAIAGVQLWHGILRKRCMNLETGLVNDNEVCGSHECSSDSVCVVSINNPNNGVSHFDDSMTALLNVFQCVTMEGWTDLQLNTVRAFGPYAIIFFTPLVLIGAFFLLNFTLAVIKSKVTDEYKANRKAKEEAKNRLQSPEELKKSAEAKLAMMKALKSKKLGGTVDKFEKTARKYCI